MKAIVGDTVIAEAPQEDLIKIEGNWYFSVNDGETTLQDQAWSYPTPYPSAGTGRQGLRKLRHIREGSSHR